jgi:uncharacterized RDD family membrane protein YckC
MPGKLSTTDLPCPLWRRLLALVYDLLIVVAIVMVVGLLCQLATGGQLISTGPRPVVPIWYQMLQATVVAAYFLSSWLRGGQTVGMRSWRIRLTRADGGTPTWRQALIRAMVAAAPLFLLPLTTAIGLHAVLWILPVVWAGWFAPALVDSRRRALHDMAAATEIRLLG